MSYILKIRKDYNQKVFTFETWNEAEKVARLLVSQRDDVTIQEPTIEQDPYFAAWSTDFSFDLELFKDAPIKTFADWKMKYGRYFGIFNNS